MKQLIITFFMLVFMASSHAVDNLGVFELDGNAVNGAATGEDFNDIHGNTSTAAQLLFVTDDTVFDGDNNDTSIFSGNSKDDMCISGAEGGCTDLWEQGSGNLTNKNDIRHGYAAAYVYTGANTGVHQYGDLLFYVGSDVQSVNGTLALSFWLLADGTVAPGAGSSWNGQHTVGDVLIQAEIPSNGSGITVRADIWNGSGLTNYSSGGSCNGSNPVLCGSANTVAINGSWRNGIGRAAFFEAGINVSAFFRSIGQAPTCTTNILFETRSSTSGTATLKDYTQGPFFDSCGANAVEVAKTSGTTLSQAGETVTYEFTINNTGLLPATLVTISDPVIDAVTPNATRDAAIAAGCDSIIGDSSCTFTVDYVIQPGDPDPLVNTVTASYEYPNGDPSGGSDDHTIELFQPSITIDKTAVASAEVQSDVVYTFTITNTSSLDTPNLTLTTITDDIIGNLFTAATTNCTTLTVTLPTNTCNFISTYNIPLTAADPLVNTVTTTYTPAGYTQTTSANDNHSLDVIPVVDISVTKDDSMTTYTPGGTGTYVITITNNGPSDVAGVTVSDLVPDGLSIGSISCSPLANCVSTNVTGQQVDATLNLANGESVIISIPVTYSMDPGQY